MAEVPDGSLFSVQVKFPSSSSQRLMLKKDLRMCSHKLSHLPG